MLDALTDPFSQALGARALVELILLGALCGPLGVWIVLYRQSYAAESVAHSMLPGLVLAALAGIPLGLGAAGGLTVAVLAIALAGRAPHVDGDTAVAVTVTALFGLGSLLALSPEVPLRIGELLFGDPLSVSTGDLLASGAVGLALAVGLVCFHRPLSLVAFDPQPARSLGASGASAELVLLGLLGATILIAVQALGNLLVVAILIGPAVAALQLCRRLVPALAAAAALAIAAGVAGLYLSYYVEIAAGASIAICAVVAAGVGLGFNRCHPRGGASEAASASR